MSQTPLNCDQCHFEPFDPFADPAGFSGSDTPPQQTAEQTAVAATD